MMEKRNVPLFKTYSDEEDVNAIAAVVRRGTYWAIGPEIEEFERQVATLVGATYALAFNSGTSALHMLMLAHGIGAGDEVIVPSFTFVATSNVVVLAGATPVFAESEDVTFGLDAMDVERRITPKTKAIIQLHYGGFPGRDSLELRRIADAHGIALIEDAAESLGANIDGKQVGTIGHSAIFSFCQNKVVSTGEGGMVVTNDRAVYEKAKLLRSHGRVELSQDYFSSIEDNDYIVAGYNLRMPTMLAALGLSQLKKRAKVVALRREHARHYDEHFRKLPGVTVPQQLPGHDCMYQMYTIQLSDERLRDSLQAHLATLGVMSKVYFNPVHLKTLYTQQYGCKEGDLPKTEALSRRVLNIPLYPSLTVEDREHIIRAIESHFKKDQ